MNEVNTLINVMTTQLALNVVTFSSIWCSIYWVKGINIVLNLTERNEERFSRYQTEKKAEKKNSKDEEIKLISFLFRLDYSEK
jgi:hypothetical protein